jgi:hypothetical protein
MVMPSSQDQVPAIRDSAENTRQFGEIKAIAVGNHDLRLQPDFRVFASAFDMDVAGFTRDAFVGIEEIT